MPGQSTILQETEFGWIVSGRYTNSRSIQKPPMQALCNLIKFHDLPILWELETENTSVVLQSLREASLRISLRKNYHTR